MKRKPISKKLRFEIFKRDNFTCQYCGRTAPDVILEVDHIKSVKNKGTNDILNLTTSCLACNRGKGAKFLNENSTLKIQQEQLKELNERKEQLELMIQWREELSNIMEFQIDLVQKEITKYYNCGLANSARQNIKNLINKFGITEVLESVNISFNKYFNEEDPDSFDFTCNKIGGICFNRKTQKEERENGS